MNVTPQPVARHRDRHKHPIFLPNSGVRRGGPGSINKFIGIVHEIINGSRSAAVDSGRFQEVFKLAAVAMPGYGFSGFVRNSRNFSSHSRMAFSLPCGGGL